MRNRRFSLFLFGLAAAAFVLAVWLFSTSPAAKAHVRLDHVIDSSIGRVRCDASKLMRAILNLLINAMKFTDHGAVVLTATLMRINEESGGQTIKFEISDSGVGMSLEEQVGLVGI